MQNVPGFYKVKEIHSISMNWLTPQRILERYHINVSFDFQTQKFVKGSLNTLPILRFVLKTFNYPRKIHFILYMKKRYRRFEYCKGVRYVTIAKDNKDANDEIINFKRA